jgi:predicted nucleic acid-binding protein
VDRTAIVNASPLIFLSRGQQTDILRHFANRILVPEPVAEEIRVCVCVTYFTFLLSWKIIIHFPLRTQNMKM